MRLAKLLSAGLTALIFGGLLVGLFPPGITSGDTAPAFFAGRDTATVLGMAIRATDCYGCNIPTAEIRRLISSGSVAAPVRVLVAGPEDPAVVAFFDRNRIPAEVSFEGTFATLRMTRMHALPFIMFSSRSTVQAIRPLPVVSLEAGPSPLSPAN